MLIKWDALMGRPDRRRLAPRTGHGVAGASLRTCTGGGPDQQWPRLIQGLEREVGQER